MSRCRFVGLLGWNLLLEAYDLLALWLLLVVFVLEVLGVFISKVYDED